MHCRVVNLGLVSAALLYVFILPHVYMFIKCTYVASALCIRQRLHL
jgi:hypothetical protein